MKKKHKHKKHKSQDSERNKEGGEAVNMGSHPLEQDKPASSSTGISICFSFVKGIFISV